MTTNTSLLKWLSTIELDGKPSIVLDDGAYFNLADGYVCGRILNQICPKYFPDNWLEGIKPVPPNGSWRLRVSNLNRILQKIYDYGSDLRSKQSTNPGLIYRPERISPDVNVIAQNFDPDQINKLIQLILFCAINCEETRDFYIKRLVNLPYKVDIKDAIEELLDRNPDSSEIEKKNYLDAERDMTNPASRKNSTPNTSHVFIGKEKSNSSFLDGSSTSNLLSPFKNLNISTHNNSNIVSDDNSEFKSNQTQSTGRGETNVGLDKSAYLLDNDSKFEEDLLLQQNKRLNLQLHEKSQEIIDLETERDDFKVKCDLLKDDLDKITQKHDIALKKAEHFGILQDELDEFKQKITNYKLQIQNLERKNTELKDELRNHQEKTSAQLERILILEEKNSQLSSGASQIDFYKKKLKDIQTKLSQETHRAEKLEDNLSKITEKYSATKKENERLYETTNQLMNTNRTSATGSSDNTANLINRVEELQRLLFQKEQELAESEGKYQKNIQKAKEVIKRLNQNNNQTVASGSLHPSCISSVSSINSNSFDEMSVLKLRLKEREEKIVELERDFYEFKKVKEIHERLMITAFYGLTTPMQWKNAEKRLERTMNSMSANNNSNNSPSISHMKHIH